MYKRQLYSYLSSVNTSGYDYSFDGTKYGGAAISALADNTITWEETTSYDAGIDFSAFGNRVLFSADWFLKRTEGILRTVNLPSQVGDLSGPDVYKRQRVSLPRRLRRRSS